jgi:hypothetical protein
VRRCRKSSGVAATDVAWDLLTVTASTLVTSTRSPTLRPSRILGSVVSCSVRE